MIHLFYFQLLLLFCQCYSSTLFSDETNDNQSNFSDMNSVYYLNDSKISNTTELLKTTFPSNSNLTIDTILNFAQISKSETNQTSTEPVLENKYPIWPLIFLSILFALIFILAFCWIISAFCKSNKEEEEEVLEQHIAVFSPKANESPNSSSVHDIESGVISVTALQSDKSPINRSIVSTTSSVESSESQHSY